MATGRRVAATRADAVHRTEAAGRGRLRLTRAVWSGTLSWMRGLVFGVCFAAGCTLAVDLDGLAGEAPGGDSGLEGSAAIDAAPPDGGAEAGADADPEAAAPAVGCARFPDASFCQDFDDAKAALASATWNGPPLAIATGSATLTAEGAVSVPNAARIALTMPVTDCNTVQLSRLFPGRSSALTTSVSVRPGGAGTFLAVIAAPSTTTGATYRVLLSIPPENNRVNAFVQMHLNGTFSGFSFDVLPMTLPPVGRNLALTVELVGAPSPSVIVREGKQLVTLPAPSDLLIKDATVALGPYCESAPVAFTFDDVVVHAAP